MRFGIIFDFVNPGPWRRRTPEGIEAAIREFCARAPYTEVISWASPLGAPRELAEESLRLFAERVLPRLAGLQREDVAGPPG